MFFYGSILCNLCNQKNPRLCLHSKHLDTLEVAGGSDIALCCDVVVMAEDEGDAVKPSPNTVEKVKCCPVAPKFTNGPQDVFKLKLLW